MAWRSTGWNAIALARLCAALPGEPAARLLPLPYPRGQGEPGRPAVRIEGVMTIEDSVIIGVAAICVFVAVLVLALRMSAPRRAGPESPEEPENLIGRAAHRPNGAGGSSDAASRNGTTAFTRSGEPKMS